MVSGLTLGHGSHSEVLPRRIDALAQTGRRFVSVAAGDHHAFALAEEGELYGWCNGYANGHGYETRTPIRVDALIGERVKLVYARDGSSCAVTEKGELFTWSKRSRYHLGHGVDTPQATPKRVEALVGVRVAAVAIGGDHTLAAAEDGVVRAFGQSSGLVPDRHRDEGFGLTPVVTPTPIPTLRVRALKFS